MKKLLLTALISAIALTINAEAKNQFYTYIDQYNYPVYGSLRRVSPNGLWATGGDDLEETGALIINTSNPANATLIPDGVLLDIDDNGLAVGEQFENVGGANYCRAAIYKDGQWTRLPLPDNTIGQSCAVAISADSQTIGGHVFCEAKDIEADPNDPTFARGRYFPIQWSLNQATGTYEISRVFNELYLPGTMGFYVYDMSPNARYICGMQMLDMGGQIPVLLDCQSGELKTWHKLEYRHIEWENNGMQFDKDALFVDGILEGEYDSAQFYGSFNYLTDRYVFGKRNIVSDVQPDGSGKVTHPATIYDIVEDKFYDVNSDYTFLCGNAPDFAFTSDGQFFNGSSTMNVNSYLQSTDVQIAGIYSFDDSGKVLTGSYIYNTAIGTQVESPVLAMLDQPEPSTAAVTLNPAPGEVNSLTTIDITFGNADWSLGSNRNGKFTLTTDGDVTIPTMYGYPGQGYYQAYFEDDVTFYTPGVYTFTIPAGKFAIDGVDLPEMKFTYTIVQSTSGLPHYVIEPEPGELHAINDGFRLSFDTEDAITVDADKVMLIKSGQIIKTTALVPTNMNYVLVIPVDDDNNAIALCDTGDYTLAFLAGAITIGDKSNTETLRFDYTITDAPVGNWEGEITPDPADNAVLQEIKNINLEFVDAAAIAVNETASPAEFPTLYNLATNAMVNRATAFANGNVLEISFPAATTAPGRYSLVIAETFLTVDGAKLDQPITLYYTIDGDTEEHEYTYTLDPAEGATLAIKPVVTITFGDVKTAENNPWAWGADAPAFIDANGTRMSCHFTPGDDGLSLTIEANYDFDVEGQCTLVIPANYFILTDANGVTFKNKEIRANYTVSFAGVEEVLAAGADSYEVYSLSGVKMLDRAKATDLRSLPAGVYIINGKKTAIR